MSLGTLLKEGAASGALSFLDKLLMLLHEQLVTGTGFNDEVRRALAVVVLWEPELRKGAASTSTKYDDQIVDEVLQYATAALGEIVMGQLRELHLMVDPHGPV